MKNKHPGIKFVLLSLSALLLGLLFGTMGAIQFIAPDFLSSIGFHQLRPLHVSLAVAWIFSAAIGGIYFYLEDYCGLKLYSKKLAHLHWWIFFVTGIAIVISYFLEKFGGREYWEFPPILSIPIIISWILFGINFFLTVAKYRKMVFDKWPVYIWMWATGIVYFMFTFLESYVWIFNYFIDDPVREITMQWKSYGALVGSWNMLVYGTALFMTTAIGEGEKIAYSKSAYLLYLLGLINLIFGWAHHIYIVPAAEWIRILAYAVSMTELIVLGKIIWTWKSSITAATKQLHLTSYRFLFAADMWIFINLILAILISIPAINLFTHGTHVTVAHSMGSTIGINTMILLASVFFIIHRLRVAIHDKTLNIALIITNISLFLFFVSLILAGVTKGIGTVVEGKSFQEAMSMATPYLVVFTLSGVGIAVGLGMIAVIGVKKLLRT